MTPYYTSQLDWLTNSGSTQSTDTGPSRDQDTGSSQGYYIYTEASFTNVSICWQCMCDANHFIVKGKDTGIMAYFVITIDKLLDVVFGVSVRIHCKPTSSDLPQCKFQ